MKTSRTSIMLILTSCCIACTDLSCMEQYNPRPFWKKIAKEQELAHRQLPKLQADGNLPENIELNADHD